MSRWWHENLNEGHGTSDCVPYGDDRRETDTRPDQSGAKGLNTRFGTAAKISSPVMPVGMNKN
jgi:hypothetical protein